MNRALRGITIFFSFTSQRDNCHPHDTEKYKLLVFFHPFPEMSTRPMSYSKLQTKMSTWTPLNHPLSNSHIFEERRNLLGKWFDKWTDTQRKQVLKDYFSKCSPNQLKYLRHILCSQAPQEALDFTTVLPRVLALYVFSFLDPRSLCRCAQVSWHWKSIVELDQLWMPKCLRLCWCINFAPTPFEQGLWKRNYIETVQQISLNRPKFTDWWNYEHHWHQSSGASNTPTPAVSSQTLVKAEFIIPEVRVTSAKRVEPTLEERTRGQRSARATTKLPLWRDTDRHPNDFVRFNYLENLDPTEQARSKGKRGFQTAAKHETSKEKMLSDSAQKLWKAKSLMFLSLEHKLREQWQHERPKWASQRFEEYATNTDTTQGNAGIRPAPVWTSVGREGTSRRSQRSTLTPLFDGANSRSQKAPPSRESEAG
ncbi:F-box only protein 16 isoform X3 [Denticeps clupeoides]|uniref:F-box only protein 16 isoform X3 n=1 Tax=Denticeps clupeoides TaxID=299321 RepID=UPI0010A47480|nr:F-box only protein 16 isoform X3 [Denticeps clupeoides]